MPSVMNLISAALLAAPAFSGVVDVKLARSLGRLSSDQGAHENALIPRTPDVLAADSLAADALAADVLAPNSDKNWQALLISIVNDARKKHNAPPAMWQDKAATVAQQNANKCKLQHSGTAGLGENIYWTSVTNPDFNAATKNAVNAWMSEEPLYGGPNNPYQALHYTQVVWAASIYIGCAWSDHACPNGGNPSGGRYFFCEYSPQGNILGQFASNVH